MLDYAGDEKSRESEKLGLKRLVVSNRIPPPDADKRSGTSFRIHA